MTEVAVFGGTFDPPTLAHERIVEACLESDEFDEVWVMPSGKRLDKPGMQDDKTRLEMLNIVRSESFGSDPRLIVSDFETKLPQPNQTFDTVRALRRAFRDRNFWFVFGADSYNTMDTWEGGDELKRSLGMLLVARAGEVMPAEGGNIKHLKIPDIDQHTISSTKAREALVAGATAEGYVSKAISSYLIERVVYL